MKYTSEFYSINQTLYKIEIDVTNKSGSDKTFKLSENPFVATIASEDKHIYSPIRCGGATVGVLTDSFIPDFYNGQAKGVKVTLYNETNSNKIEWVGYVTPSVYSQGFDDYLEELELDCVDGIAVLKNILYVPKNGEGEIKTLGQIIYNCLKESGVYSAFYISDNVQFTATGTESVITKMRISENNFLDEKDDPNQTIDDVAWSCYDVLYQILQYLGYTLVVEGDEVFIIDYDAIKNGNNRYFKYSLTGDNIPTPTVFDNLNYSKFIDGGDYAQNGTNIEMTEIFNKVTVKDEFATFDSLFPHYDDINYQTNITPASDVMPSDFSNYQFLDVLYEERNGVKDYFYVIIVKCWKGKYMAVMMRFYDNALFEMKRYTSSSTTITDVSNNSIWNNQCRYSDMLKYNGGYYYRYWHKEMGKSSVAPFLVKYNKCTTNSEKLKAWKEYTGESKFDLQPITMFLNQGTGRIQPADGVNLNSQPAQINQFLCSKYPFMKLKSDMSSKIFGGENAQIRIAGSWLYHDENSTPFPISDGANNKKLKRDVDYKYAEEGWFFAKLKWGNYYWNGSEWTTSENFFKLYLWGDKISPKERTRQKDLFDKWFSFTDNTAKELTKNRLEHVIPCPDGFNLQGGVEMELYTRDLAGRSPGGHWHPDGTKTDNRYARYFCRVICFKDLEIIPEIASEMVDDGSSETDTIYTNVITNGSVNGMDEITFKVCTEDNKKPNYSSVDYLDSSNKSQYVRTLYNKALRAKESGSAGCDGNTDGALRQEEHYIFKLATQYENPMLVFECNLKNDGHRMYGTYTDKTLSGKTFVVDERDIDYKQNSVRLKMIEKF